MPESPALFAAHPHTWTLPLAPNRWGYLQLPSRCIDDDEWEQLMVLLQVFKPGLVTDRSSAADDETEPVVESAFVGLGSYRRTHMEGT